MGGMLVAYRLTCRQTIGRPLSVDISTDISVECQLTYWPMLDRYVGRYIERHISVDILADTRPICRPTYRSTLGRYVDRYIGWLSVDMSVEGCTKYTGSKNTRVYWSWEGGGHRIWKSMDACWKFWIKPLKETNHGMAQDFLTHKMWLLPVSPHGTFAPTSTPLVIKRLKFIFLLPRKNVHNETKCA